MRMRMRMCGGGRVYIGVYACLRFERVLNLLLGAQEGGLKGCLFAGKVTIAELEEEAFKGVFCTFWECIGKRGAKGGKGAV
jgi:hypothetical protein